MRPLVLNYDQDPAVRTMNDEYMVGDELLVAPVVQEGQNTRAVYLPAGEWIDFWNGVEYAGKRTILVEAPIDKLPLFVKNDTIIPWGPEVSHISDEPNETMTFRLYGQNASYIHYQDNGLDFAYQSGEYNLYQIKASQNGATIDMLHNGYDKNYRKIFVELNDQKLTFEFDPQTQTYVQQ